MCPITSTYYILDNTNNTYNTNNTNNTYYTNNTSTYLYSSEERQTDLIVITTIIFISGMLSGIWEYC